MRDVPGLPKSRAGDVSKWPRALGLTRRRRRFISGLDLDKRNSGGSRRFWIQRLAKSDCLARQSDTTGTGLPGICLRFSAVADWYSAGLCPFRTAAGFMRVLCRSAGSTRLMPRNKSCIDFDTLCTAGSRQHARDGHRLNISRRRARTDEPFGSGAPSGTACRLRRCGRLCGDASPT